MQVYMLIWVGQGVGGMTLSHWLIHSYFYLEESFPGKVTLYVYSTVPPSISSLNFLAYCCCLQLMCCALMYYGSAGGEQRISCL